MRFQFEQHREAWYLMGPTGGESAATDASVVF